MQKLNKQEAIVYDLIVAASPKARPLYWRWEGWLLYSENPGANKGIHGQV